LENDPKKMPKGSYWLTLLATEEKKFVRCTKYIDKKVFSL